MAWDVAVSREFERWWYALDESEQDAVTAVVELLEEHGPMLGFPHSSSIRGSKYSQMRELRIQHKGDPYWVLYAFDPMRAAILLFGGNKRGQERWYKENVVKALRLFEQHLRELRNER